MVGRTISWAAGYAILLLVTGCEHASVRVNPPAPLPVPEAQNDQVVARYRGMVGPRQGKGLIAVEITNKSDRPIPIQGEQGALVPTKNDQRAWLVFRESDDLKRFLSPEMTLDLEGPEAKLTLNVPSAGIRDLPPGESTVLLVAYALTPAAEELSFDLSPVVSTGNVHDEKGDLRALYLTVPMKDRPTIVDQAKHYINNTSLGVNLTSDDVMN
jgi:hypothetical protein